MYDNSLFVILLIVHHLIIIYLIINQLIVVYLIINHLIIVYLIVVLLTVSLLIRFGCKYTQNVNDGKLFLQKCFIIM